MNIAGGDIGEDTGLIKFELDRLDPPVHFMDATFTQLNELIPMCSIILVIQFVVIYIRQLE